MTAEGTGGAAGATAGAGQALPRTTNPYSYLVYLVPPLAGLAIGVACNGILSDDNTLLILWPGLSLDPGSLPPDWLVKSLGALAGLALWLATAAILKHDGPMKRALAVAAPGFAPFLLILLLNALSGIGGYDLISWSALALVLSFAALAGWVVAVGLASGIGAFRSAAAFIRRHALVIVVALGLTYFAVSASMGLLMHHAVTISYDDCGDWDEMLWKTLHGQFLMCSEFNHCFFGQHVEFIQLLLLPIYMLRPGLPVLLVTLSLALACGVIPVYLLAKMKIRSTAAAVLFCAAYIFYAPLQYADKQIINNPFLPEVFYIPIMLWALYFLFTKRLGWLAVMAFLALSCKEEMALPLGMFGVVFAMRRQWGWAATYFFGAFAWFILSLAVVSPYFQQGPSHVVTLGYYAEMGSSMREILTTVFTKPLYTLSHMVAFRHLDFMAMMLVPFGCLALFSPTMVLIFLPTIASTALAAWPPSSMIYYHYHVSLVPFPIVGAVFGTANIMRLLGRPKGLWGGVEELRGSLVAAFCGVLVLAASAAGDVLYGKFPLSLRFYNSQSYGYWRHLYVRSPRAEVFLERALPMVPREAKVSATHCFGTFFTHHAAAYEYPVGVDKADYVVLQEFEPIDEGLTYSVVREIGDNDRIEGLERIFDEGGVFVFKRKR